MNTFAWPSLLKTRKWVKAISFHWILVLEMQTEWQVMVFRLMLSIIHVLSQLACLPNFTLASGQIVYPQQARSCLELTLKHCNASVIREKGEFQTGVNKKTKDFKLSVNRAFLTSWYAHVRRDLSKQFY